MEDGAAVCPTSTSPDPGDQCHLAGSGAQVGLRACNLGLNGWQLGAITRLATARPSLLLSARMATRWPSSTTHRLTMQIALPDAIPSTEISDPATYFTSPQLLRDPDGAKARPSLMRRHRLAAIRLPMRLSAAKARIPRNRNICGASISAATRVGIAWSGRAFRSSTSLCSRTTTLRESQKPSTFSSG